MAIQIAPAATVHPVDRRLVGESTLASPRIDAEMSDGRRIATAMVLLMAGALFLSPPAVAVLVVAGMIR
jgi:hypothetical protein